MGRVLLLLGTTALVGVGLAVGAHYLGDWLGPQLNGYHALHIIRPLPGHHPAPEGRCPPYFRKRGWYGGGW